MMKRIFAFAALLALSTSAFASNATLKALSWTTAKGKPALALVLVGHSRAHLSALHHGRLLRIHLPHTIIGSHVRDLRGLSTVKGVYPYLTDHRQGINIDILLKHSADMALKRTPNGYLAILSGLPVRVTAPRKLASADNTRHSVASGAVKTAGQKAPLVYVKKITYSAFPGNRMEIHLVTSGEAFAPSTFVLTKPPMIVLDLPHTRLHLSRPSVAVGKGAVDSVTAVESGDLSRIVIKLIASAGYRTYVRPHAVDIVISSPHSHISEAAILAPHAHVFASPANHGRYEIRSISFHRGREGAGKIAVGLSSSNVNVSVHSRGHHIIMDFHNTYAPQSLQKRLIVTDFATPVDTIKTFVSGHTTRIILSASGTYTQTGYQSGHHFIMRVAPLSTAAYQALQRQNNRYASRKISLNFQKISVRSALQVLANFTGLNFVTSNDVHGNLSLQLHDVPWKEALSLILTTKDLGKKRIGNIILVEPARQLDTQEQAQLKAAAQAEKLEPLETVLIRMNYAKAKDIAKLLKSTRTVGGSSSPSVPFSSVSYSKATTESTSLLSKRGQVTVDKRTNSLIIQDTPRRIAAIRALIAKLDKPVRQVLIEARLVEANDGFNKTLGAQLGLNYAYSTPTTSFTTQPVQPTVTPVSGFNGFNINLPSNGIAKFPAATLALTVAKLASNNLLNLELSALQAENKAKIISSPRLITANDRAADIKQGQEQFFNLGFGQATMEQAVLGLKVTPQITPDNRVIMTVKITDNTFANAVEGTLNEKSMKTQVLVNNGQTVVIGGIYQTNRLRTVTKIPFLGDLPLIGFFFRNTNVSNTRQELLIFLTPRILSPSLSLASG